MDRYLTKDHEALREEIRDFAETRIRPVARALDERSEFPWENVRAMADKGWFGIPVPQEYGGMGRDYLSYTLAARYPHIVRSPARIPVADNDYWL